MLKLYLIPLSLIAAAPVFADSCNRDVLVVESVQESLNLFQDPTYYSKRVLNRETFCKVVSKVADLFPEHDGVKIKYNAFWDSPDPNASADYINSGNEYTINIYGGLLDLGRFSESALVAITCHELGHIKGGTPDTRGFRDNRRKKLNTSEGFADYYASHVCMKKYFGNEAAIDIPRTQRIANTCEGENDKTLCTQVLNAAYDNFFATSTGKFNLDLPSTSIAIHTSIAAQNHPNPDCRFDTMIAGYFCKDTNSRWPCGFAEDGHYLNSGDATALPPHCFFKP